MLAFIGRLFTAFLGGVLALGCFGAVQSRLDAKKGRKDPSGEDGVLSQKTVENVHDLNDIFNRARYMGKDGE